MVQCILLPSPFTFAEEYIFIVNEFYLEQCQTPSKHSVS